MIVLQRKLKKMLAKVNNKVIHKRKSFLKESKPPSKRKSFEVIQNNGKMDLSE